MDELDEDITRWPEDDDPETLIGDEIDEEPEGDDL